MSPRWINSVALAATLLVTGCTGSIGAGGPGGGDVVNDNIAKSLCVVDTPIRRLNRFVYNNTVRDLLGDTTHPADVLPPEEEVAGFSNQAAALTTSDLLIEQYMKVAEDVGERAVQNVDALIPDCDSGVDGEDVCASQFIDDFGLRAFRRPLTLGESTRYKALFDAAVQDPDLGRFEDGIQMVIEAVLQSPSFLYRVEVGEETTIEADIVPFTRWEMATNLS